MAAWLVVEGEKRHYFICGPCASSFYNADRENRSEPKEADPPAGAKTIECQTDFT